MWPLKSKNHKNTWTNFRFPDEFPCQPKNTSFKMTWEMLICFQKEKKSFSVPFLLWDNLLTFQKWRFLFNLSFFFGELLSFEYVIKLVSLGSDYVEAEVELRRERKQTRKLITFLCHKSSVVSCGLRLPSTFTSW